MRKILVLLLAASLILVSFSGCTTSENSPAGDTTESNTEEQSEDLQPNPASDFEYEHNDEGGITILRYIGQRENVVIPDTIQNKPVTKIGHTSFTTSNEPMDSTPSNIVVSLKLPDTVTTIANNAFYKCDKLERIVLSKNLIEIGSWAFYDCTSLKHITIPSTVREFGGEAFANTGLESVTFEEGIEVIGGYGSFANTKLSQIVLPSTVKEIGLSTFASNANLEMIILNDGLITIGHKAFVNNPKLKEIIIPKTVEYVTEMDFNLCSSLEKVMFEGNAPATFEYSDYISGLWEPYDVNFTVYYHEGAIGFTSPTWFGYPTEIW